MERKKSLTEWCKDNNKEYLISEWDYTQNAPLTPNDVSQGTHKKVWWICKEGHEWEALINSRTRGNGCPYCSNQRVLTGYNDFYSWCIKNKKDNLLGDWNYEKNKDIDPKTISFGSVIKVFWKCRECGFEWTTSVRARTIHGTGCTKCADKNAGKKIIINKLKKEGSLEDNYPGLAKEWDYSKNDKSPQEVTAGSNQSVWWICPEGHNYEAKPAERKRGRGCPYCTGKRVIVGKTDLATTHPNLIKEWFYEKNTISPEEVSSGCGKKVWWKCINGHEWQATIDSRTGGNGCPVCSNKKIVKGYNDLETLSPELAKEWDVEKNLPLLPTMVSANYNKKVWWKCCKGHEWKTTVNARTSNKSGCPYCAGHKVIVGETDFATIHPELLSEWNFEKNMVNPHEIAVGSKEKVWWKCKKGHEWKSAVGNRTGKKGNGCPICGNKQIVPGVNDFQTAFPEIASEWNFDKNGGKLPNQFAPKSGEKVWWKCKECGYEWAAAIVDRSCGARCPKCVKDLQTSFGEQAVYFYVKKLFPDTINGDRRFGKELDILVPSINTAIEYDGRAWHKSVKADIKKNEICRREGIRLYRIREIGCPDLPEEEGIKIFPYVYGKTDSLTHIIQTICNSISSEEIDVDVKRDEMLIYEQYLSDKRERSLAHRFPQLIAEWDDEKNGTLTPYNTYASSPKYVWWNCTVCGYSWKTSPNNRTANGKVSVCPKCAQKYVGKCNARRVKNLDTGDVYESVSDALRKTGINNISACCNGKLYKAGGYRWQYLDGHSVKKVKNVETGEIYNHSSEAERRTGINRKKIKQACEDGSFTAGGYHWEYC